MPLPRSPLGRDSARVARRSRWAGASIEADTDAQEQSIADALGDSLDQVCEQLEQWAARCIEAGAFPADILKRAAG